MKTNTSTLSQDIIEGIRAAIGPAPAVLHEPSFNGNEWLYLKECLDSTYVSSVGKYVDRFEIDLAKYGYSVSETLFGEIAQGQRIQINSASATQGVWLLKN